MTPFEHTKAAIAAAKAHGWKFLTTNAVQRAEEHETPDTIPAQWWPYPKYESLETLEFMFSSPDRVPMVFHRTTTAPWVKAHEARIPFKGALEILAVKHNDNEGN